MNFEEHSSCRRFQPVVGRYSGDLGIIGRRRRGIWALAHQDSRHSKTRRDEPLILLRNHASCRLGADRIDLRIPIVAHPVTGPVNVLLRSKCWTPALSDGILLSYSTAYTSNVLGSIFGNYFQVSTRPSHARMLI